MSGGLTLPSEACLRVCGILFVDVVLPSAVLYTSSTVEQLRGGVCVRAEFYKLDLPALLSAFILANRAF